MLLPPLRHFGKVMRRGVSFTTKSAGVVGPPLARVAVGNVTVRTQRPLPLSFPLNKTSPYFSLFTLEFCPLARRFAKVIFGFSGRAKDAFCPVICTARSHRAQRASLKGSLQPPLQRQSAAAAPRPQEGKEVFPPAQAARRA